VNGLFRNGFAVLLILTGFLSASAESINPVSSELRLQLRSQADDSLVPVIKTAGMSHGSITTPLQASAKAVSEYSGGEKGIQAGTDVFGSAKASWGKDNGILNLFEIGWRTQNPSLIDLYADLYAGLDWQFVFTPLVDGIFNLDYALKVEGDNAYGLNEFTYSLQNTEGNVHDFFKFDGFGDFHHNLVAHETYTVTIQNQASFEGPFDSFDTQMTGYFHWSFDAILPVPESTCTLVLLSLGLLGLMKRGRFS